MAFLLPRDPAGGGASDSALSGPLSPDTWFPSCWRGSADLWNVFGSAVSAAYLDRLSDLRAQSCPISIEAYPP